MLTHFSFLHCSSSSSRMQNCKTKPHSHFTLLSAHNCKFFWFFWELFWQGVAGLVVKSESDRRGVWRLELTDYTLNLIIQMGDAGSSGSGGSPAPTMAVGGSGSGEPGGSSLKEQFTAFSKFGDATSDGKQITLSNADKWMKQAHVIDGKKITTTDTSITFKKLFK